MATRPVELQPIAGTDAIWINPDCAQYLYPVPDQVGAVLVQLCDGRALIVRGIAREIARELWGTEAAPSASGEDGR